MNFFEPPPPPPEPEHTERVPPPWFGPPDNVLGGFVAEQLILARTEDSVLLVDHLRAYPTGFEHVLQIRRRRSEGLDPEAFHVLRSLHLHHRDGGDPNQIPPEVLRFGIQFSDGSKATNLGGHWASNEDEEPAGPVLMERGGGGGDDHYEQRYWVWPLPPEGPLAFVCEWPARNIPLTRHEIDASVIREAAGRAERLWAEVPRQGAWQEM